MKRKDLIIWTVAVLSFVLLPVLACFSQAPEPALSLPCKIVEVYDGDTVTAQVTILIRVRLIDCWAPELNQPGGFESRDHLRNLALDKDGILVVPMSGKRTVGSLFSFDRVVGRVYVENSKEDVSSLQVNAGYATVSRE